MGQRMQLTDEQWRVVMHDGTHAVVSAVAGSGKSTTLVERIARLIADGADPRRILPVQYNKSAQLSMQGKLDRRLDGVSPSPKARTFHSIGYGMLKRLVATGILEPVRLETSEGIRDRYLRRSLRAAWTRTHGKNTFPTQQQFEAYSQFVTCAKADTRGPADVFRSGEYGIDCAPFVAAIGMMDQEARKAGICFFDDLLSDVYWCLRDRPELWGMFRGYELFLIDEFQDINPVQYALLQGIVGDAGECMVVGDPDQAIYRYRGSDPSFINTRFERDFMPCAKFRLSRTFRYGHETALVANHVITKNEDRDDKITVASDANPDTRVSFIRAQADGSSGIVPMLQQAKEEGTLKDIAILVRYYSASVPLEIELAAAGIPCHTYGREPLLLIPEIAALVAAVSLANGHWVMPASAQATFLQALLQTPPIYAPASITSQLAMEMAAEIAQGRQASGAVFAMAGKVADGKLADRLRRRGDVIRLLESGGLKGKPPLKTLQTYLAITNAKAALQQAAGSKMQAREIEQNITAFTMLAQRHDDPVALLDQLGPMAARQEGRPPREDHVAICSYHRSKGLEYPTVILPGWLAGEFPREGEPIEEERRLAYVAITRAVQELVFLVPPDPVFDESLDHLDQAIGRGGARNRRTAISPFLFDAEIGLAKSGRDAIVAGETTCIEGRRADVLNRYMAEAGHEGISAVVPAHLRARDRATAEQAGITIVPNMTYLQNNGETYLVVGTAGIEGDFYVVKPLSGGLPRLMSLSEPGWFQVA